MRKETITPENNERLFDENCITYEVIQVKPYSAKEICNIYNISEKTFAKWTCFFNKAIGQKRGRYYTVRQVEIIFNSLGLPYRIREEE